MGCLPTREPLDHSWDLFHWAQTWKWVHLTVFSAAVVTQLTNNENTFHLWDSVWCSRYTVEREEVHSIQVGSLLGRQKWQNNKERCSTPQATRQLHLLYLASWMHSSLQQLAMTYQHNKYPRTSQLFNVARAVQLMLKNSVPGARAGARFRHPAGTACILSRICTTWPCVSGRLARTGSSVRMLLSMQLRPNHDGSQLTWLKSSAGRRSFVFSSPLWIS